MNRSIELTLNTDITRFEAWLDRYRINTLGFIIDQDDNDILMVRKGPTFQREIRNVRYHEIIALAGEKLPDGRQKALYPPIPVIQIELFEPAEKRLNLKIELIHPALVHYCVEMLSEISKLWPETSHDVINASIRLKAWAVLGELPEFIPDEPTSSIEPEQPQQTKRKIAPNREEDYKSWQSLWLKYVRSWVNLGKRNPSEIKKELEKLSREKRYIGKVYGSDTIRKIIQAGEAGELDELR